MANSILFWTPNTNMGSICRSVAKNGLPCDDGKTKVKKINKSKLRVTLKEGETTSVFFILNLFNLIFTPFGKITIRNGKEKTVVENTLFFNLSHGKLISHSYNGALLAEANYFLGLNHGSIKAYYDNGNLKHSIGTFLGILHGVSLKYDEKGQITEDKKFFLGIDYKDNKNKQRNIKKKKTPNSVKFLIAYLFLNSLITTFFYILKKESMLKFFIPILGVFIVIIISKVIITNDKSFLRFFFYLSIFLSLVYLTLTIVYVVYIIPKIGVTINFISSFTLCLYFLILVVYLKVMKRKSKYN